MKSFTVGANLFCDFHFGGKPKAKCVAVVKPGSGRDSHGLIRARITEDGDAYRKGQIVELSSFLAVPCEMERPRKRGEFFRRISTLYRWE